MQNESVLLTEAPLQPNLLFPAAFALNYSTAPLLLLLSPLHLSLLLLLSESYAESSAPPPSSTMLCSLLCSLSRVLSASDGSIHEKCDVSRFFSDLGDAAARPLTSQVLQELEECQSPASVSIPPLVFSLFFSWIRQFSLSLQLFLSSPPIPASELRAEKEP